MSIEDRGLKSRVTKLGMMCDQSSVLLMTHGNQFGQRWRQCQETIKNLTLVMTGLLKEKQKFLFLTKEKIFFF